MIVDRSRFWMIGAIVAMVAVVALGVLLGVQPQLSAAAAADAQQASTAADNASKQAALDKLKSDYTKLPELKRQLTALEASVPPSAKMSSFISAVDELAATTHTTIASITVSDAQPYTPPARPAAPATSATGTSGSTSTPSPSASPSATATPAPAPTAATPQAPTPVTNPQITAANFVAIPITIGIKGDYGHALDFVDGLQHGSRLFLVTSFASAGSDGESSAPDSWTVGGYAYVLLDATAKTGASASK